jgi:hypothetical protein
MTSNGTLQDGCDERYDVRFRKRWRCLLRVKDGPLLSRARSRSKGPLSDQVADAPDACRQSRSWVDSGGSIVLLRTAAIGAMQPMRPRPGEGRSCPEADPHDHPRERRGRVVSGHSPRWAATLNLENPRGNCGASPSSRIRELGVAPSTSPMNLLSFVSLSGHHLQRVSCQLQDGYARTGAILTIDIASIIDLHDVHVSYVGAYIRTLRRAA